MHVSPECTPCYLKQALAVMRAAGVKEMKKNDYLMELLPLIGTLDRESSPAENSSIILHYLYKMLKNPDPFAQAKVKSNTQALTMVPHLLEIIAAGADPLLVALKVAVAGNIIDLGIVPKYDLNESLKNALVSSYPRFDYTVFLSRLQKARKILVIGDNSGEIVFDRLLLEQLQPYAQELFYTVKSEPILNDATIDDAQQASIEMFARVLPTGSNYLGIIERYSSPGFLAVLHDADIVISKGQANYESLEASVLAGTKTFFLLMAKCEVVARNLGVNVGELVFVQKNV